MVTTGQPAFQMLCRSERFADTHEGRAAVQRMCQLRLSALFERLENEIGVSGYTSDARPDIADMYLYVLARWGLQLARSTKNYPRVWALARNMTDLPLTGYAWAHVLHYGAAICCGSLNNSRNLGTA